MGLDEPAPFLTERCVFFFIVYFYIRKARPTMSARRSSVSLSPGCDTGSFCILFVVFLFRRESGNSRRQLTHARPLPQSHPQFRIFGNVFGGDWLLIVMDEFLLTFTLILQLLPLITLCYPCAYFRFFAYFFCSHPLDFSCLLASSPYRLLPRISSPC